MTQPESFDLIADAMQLAKSKPLCEKPAILLAATDRWVPTARLAMALANAGCYVDAVCPSGHPVAKTRAVYRIFTYNGVLPMLSFTRAIRLTRPDLVIPCDDLATRHFHEIYDRERRTAKAESWLSTLIEYSLGAAEGFKVIGERGAFMQLAKEEGLRVPKTQVLTDSGDLLNWIARVGFPTVLKANGTSGGDGVRFVNTVEEAERAFRKLEAPPLLARAVKRAIMDRDLTLLLPSLFRRHPVVNAQTFVAGHEAT